ncbi:MAG: nucleoside deaminase [Oscillospiraceae bacterium]|nr:nucleoside deaminase [Oscillospiraceae bacterium]
MNKFMKVAFDEASEGMKFGHGGPFGAVIVQNGEIIACAHNQVLLTNDPTMHAEVAAIRKATDKLGRYSLRDCEIYSTCMPCPMCLSAIIWAKIPKLYYGSSAEDAADAGFDDDYIYEYIRGGLADETRLKSNVLDAEPCGELFAEWKKNPHKRMY